MPSSTRRMRTGPGAAHPSARRTSFGLGLGCVGTAALFAVLVAANAGNALDPRQGFGGAVAEIRPSVVGTTRAAEQDAFAGWLRSGGERLPARIVVSNADAAHTYRRMVPASARRRWTDARIDRARQSMSLFVWYFGTRRRYEEVPHHTILLGPRYRGLLDDIFEKKVLADDFSLYLHRPTATDPSLAPEGCDAFYVLSPVPHLESGTDWRAMAEPYKEKIAAYLERTVMPDLRANVISSHLVTPLTFEDRFSSFRGAAFGLEPVLTQSAYFRPHNQSEEVERLYLVGAGTHPGAGMPGVLSSARVLDSIVPDPDKL